MIKIGIVASDYHKDILDKMVEIAVKTAEELEGGIFFLL